MREHDPGVERLKADFGDEGTAAHGMPRVLEALLEDVDRRLGVLGDHPPGTPVAPRGRTGLIAVVLGRRVERALGQFKGDHVVFVGGQKPFALLGGDHVVGRCGHR